MRNIYQKSNLESLSPSLSCIVETNIQRKKMYITKKEMLFKVVMHLATSKQLSVQKLIELKQ